MYKYLILFFLLIVFILSNIKENYYTYNNHCQNLNYKECLDKPKCGWLKDRMPAKGRCVVGSPEGPLDPRLLPEAEEGYYKNRQIDFWTYSRANNNYSCLYNDNKYY